MKSSGLFLTFNTLIPFKLQPTQTSAKISSKPGGFDAWAKTLKTEECGSGG